MDSHTLEVLNRVSAIASKAGIKGEIDDEAEHYAAGFELPDDRSQMVYVKVTATNEEDGTHVVTIFSPCQVYKKGFMGLGGITKSQCIELLVQNEQLTFARFGIWDGDGELMVVASVDQLLDTLDPPEFEAAMWHIAMAADSVEAPFGTDEF